MIKDTSFISHDQANKVEEFVLNPLFPWNLQLNSVDYDESVFEDKNTVEHYQFTHTLYSGDIPQSNFFQDFHQLFIDFVSKNKIEYKSLLRMKINLVTKNSDFGDSYMPPHVDAPFDHKVFIYYINNSDGNTVFFDENKNIVESVAPEKGLGVCFDGNTFHSNRLPVDNNFRCVLNVTFL